MAVKGLLSRRSFLKRTAAFLAAPYIIPSGVLGQNAPSRRITLGAIGTGGMGEADIKSFLWVDGIQVIAVCDVDSQRREAAKQVVEKHYAKYTPDGGFKGCSAHGDFRELLARDDIDAVLIATPDHWHIRIALAAVRAGKDIYCEKPLSLTVAEGRMLSDTVRRYGTVFQTGSQQRSDWRFRRACELVRNGRIGKLERIKAVLVDGKEIGPQPAMPVPEWFDYDMWLGPAPWAPYTRERCHYNFRYVLDYSGGALTDWGAHNNDIAQWGNGTELSGPVEVEGEGKFPDEGLYDTAVHFDLKYRYANGVELECTSRGDTPGVAFEGTEGRIWVSRDALEAKPEKILDSRIRPGEIRLYRSEWHHKNFADCVRSRGPTAAPPEIAHRSITICHIGNIAMLLKRKLRWDPEREIFPDDADANRMLARGSRSPWRL